MFIVCTHQQDPLYDHIVWNIQYPVHWIMWQQSQDYRSWTIPSNKRYINVYSPDIKSQCPVNSISIASKGAQHMNFRIAAHTGCCAVDTAVGCLGSSSVCCQSNSIACIFLNVTASVVCCTTQKGTQVSSYSLTVISLVNLMPFMSLSKSPYSTVPTKMRPLLYSRHLDWSSVPEIRNGLAGCADFLGSQAVRSLAKAIG